MDCVDEPVSYFDYENITTQAMADSLDCGVRKLKLTTAVLLFPVEMSFFAKPIWSKVLFFMRRKLYTEIQLRNPVD